MLVSGGTYSGRQILLSWVTRVPAGQGTQDPSSVLLKLPSQAGAAHVLLSESGLVGGAHFEQTPVYYTISSLAHIGSKHVSLLSWTKVCGGQGEHVPSSLILLL